MLWNSANRHLVVLWFCVLLSSMLPCGHARVFSSSEKLSTLSDTSVEASLLDSLDKYISDEFDKLNKLSQLVKERKEETPVWRNKTNEGQHTKSLHPNEAYHLIKRYVHVYYRLRATSPKISDYFDKNLPELPTESDYSGACSSMVLLTRIYDLNITDVIAGNYSGYLGPPLYAEDVFEIGRFAFNVSLYEESCKWLRQASFMLQKDFSKGGDSDKVFDLIARTLGLLIRAHKFLNQSEKANEVLSEALSLSITEDRMKEMMKQEMTDSQLFNNNREAKVTTTDHNEISHLCRRDKLERVPVQYGYHICRYKADLYTPYVRYKEEILSQSPFASLFYDVITDAEIEEMKNAVRGNMDLGQVTRDSNFLPLIRNNDVAFIFDGWSKAADRLAKRIKGMTGLQVLGPRDSDHRTVLRVSEAYQMALYGMGGHYKTHMDCHTDINSTFYMDNLRPNDSDSDTIDYDTDDNLESGFEMFGNRLATYLIYLTDVEKGGHTVFTRGDISVAPQKGMALFWYNWDTRMYPEGASYHAGCPVLIGTKWIASKWIHSGGTNSFRRRCGLYEDAIQQDIEPLMYEAHREIEKNGGWRHAF